MLRTVEKQLSWDLPPKPRQWPEYRPRARVLALRIKDVAHAAGGGATLYFEPGYDPEFRDSAWCVANGPAPGGYLVRDGSSLAFYDEKTFLQMFEI